MVALTTCVWAMHLALSLIEDDVHGLQLHHAGIHPQSQLFVNRVQYLRFWYAVTCAGPKPSHSCCILHTLCPSNSSGSATEMAVMDDWGWQKAHVTFPDIKPSD